jgi:hypothetical protein
MCFAISNTQPAHRAITDPETHPFCTDFVNDDGQCSPDSRARGWRSLDAGRNPIIEHGRVGNDEERNPLFSGSSTATMTFPGRRRSRGNFMNLPLNLKL